MFDVIEIDMRSSFPIQHTNCQWSLKRKKQCEQTCFEINHRFILTHFVLISLYNAQACL
jgi:hypothetical protein